MVSLRVDFTDEPRVISYEYLRTSMVAFTYKQTEHQRSGTQPNTRCHKSATAAASSDDTAVKSIAQNVVFSDKFTVLGYRELFYHITLLCGRYMAILS